MKFSASSSPLLFLVVLLGAFACSKEPSDKVEVEKPDVLVALSQDPPNRSGSAEVSEEPVDVFKSEITRTMKESEPARKGELEIATLAGGCFWCTEAIIEQLDGVEDVVSGYMGGHVDNPTYEQVCGMKTGHAEVIQVTFDPAVVSYEDILDIFWQAHDPTTLNQQGADRGPQYRSAIFYHSPEQKKIAESSKFKLDSSGLYSDPAVTEITEASTFWKAEESHQDYYRLNRDKNPYCSVVITPKMKKLGFE